MAPDPGSLIGSESRRKILIKLVIVDYLLDVLKSSKNISDVSTSITAFNNVVQYSRNTKNQASVLSGRIRIRFLFVRLSPKTKFPESSEVRIRLISDRIRNSG